MSLRDERAAVFILDKVNFIQGVFKEKVPVDPEELPHDIEEGYRIRFYPMIPSRKSWGKYFVNYLPDFISDYALVRETNTVYPAAAIDGPRSVPAEVKMPGSPNWMIVLHEDINGDAPFASHVEMITKGRIRTEQSRREESEAGETLAHLDKFGGEEVVEEAGRGPSDRQNFPG